MSMIVFGKKRDFLITLEFCFEITPGRMVVPEHSFSDFFEYIAE